MEVTEIPENSDQCLRDSENAENQNRSLTGAGQKKNPARRLSRALTARAVKMLK